MNPAVFGSTLPAACSLGTQGSGAGDYGPDRIAKTFYDAAGRAYQTKTALGTADEATDVTATFTANGQVETVTDAENNKTTYEYDGHDRLAKTRFPSATKGAGTSSTTDYEQPTYESLTSGTRTSNIVVAYRNRGNQTAAFGYDAFGRPTSKDLPGTEPDVTYGYDLLGRLTSASQTGAAFTFAYDALGRRLSETGPRGTVSSDLDLAGRRTRIVYPDGFFVDQDYLVTGDIWKIRENGTASGIGILATFGYDNLGRRSTLTRGNGTVTSYGYDAMSRLTSLGQDLGGTAYDLTLGFAYNPASQIASNTRSNDAYAWLGHGSGSTASTANGLNQITVHGGAAVGHDAKGNLNSDPTIGKTYGYSSENLLTSVGATGTLTYDPLMRLSETGISAKSKFVHDGQQRITEYYGAANAPMARFVNAPGLDEPLVEYQGASLATRRWLHADERGSIVARSDDSGNIANVNTFDEQGLIGPTNAGRFHFAGQPYETMSELYDSRARMRNPRFGRFNQPDPIGYGDGMNFYAYVKGDPVNRRDPTGLQDEPDIIITGHCGILCKIARALSHNIGGGSGDSGGGFERPWGTPSAAAPSTGERVGGAKKPAPKPQPKDGEKCNQQVLDAAHAVQDFSKSLDARGNDMLKIAAVAAVAGVPLVASGVGAPGAAGVEITAGGIAAVGLGAKAIGGFGQYAGDLVARIETGTAGGFARSLLSAASSTLPDGSIFQQTIQDQTVDAVKTLLGGEDAPRSCPG